MSNTVLLYFVTCPCSSRTKRHDNLFVDDDDDDDNSPMVLRPILHIKEVLDCFRLDLLLLLLVLLVLLLCVCVCVF